MSRFKIGALLGGAAVFFFDPQQGEDRRRRLQSLWRDNSDAVLQVGAGASQAAESMRPLVRRMRRGLKQGDWAGNSGVSWVPAVTGIFVASVLGGALVYFLDPQNGLVRRNSLQKAAGTVKPRAKQAVAEASKVADYVMAKGRG